MLSTLIVRNFPGFRYYQFPSMSTWRHVPAIYGGSLEMSALEIANFITKPHHIAHQIKGYLITFSVMYNLLGFVLNSRHMVAVTARTLSQVALLVQSYS